MEPLLSTPYRLRLALVKIFDRLCQIPKWRTLEQVFGQVMVNRDDLFFIQIGANDGVIYDPIYPFVKKSNWRGVLVEPVPVYFNRLKANYENNSRLIFENVAISDRCEVRDFYRVDDKFTFLPKWCHGLGTFDLDVLMSHTWAIPDLEKYVVKEQVECVDFHSLLAKYDVKNIDLLLVDTEGYDYQILKQIDFDSIAPDILLYEHQYFDKSEKSACEKTLIERGYSLSRHFGNTLAFLKPRLVS